MDQAQTALPAEALRLRDAVSRRLHDVYHVQIPRLSECKDVSEYETELHETLQRIASLVQPVSYTHLTLPTICLTCRSRWSPYH